jgi:O-antigen/teichoic acid export membrane protein
LSTDIVRIPSGLQRIGAALNELLHPRVSGNIIPMVAASGAGQVGQWLASIVLVTYLGAAEFGAFSFGMSLCLIFLTLGAYGMPVLIVKEVVQGRGARFMAASVILRLSLAGGLVITGGLIILVTTHDGADRTMGWILLLVPLIMAFDITSVLDAERVARYEAYLQLARRLIYLGLVIVLVPWLGWNEPTAPAAAFALSTLIFVLVQWRVVRHNRSFRLRDGISHVHEALVLGSPLFFSTLMVNTYTYADGLIVKWFKGNADLGIYSAASQNFTLLAGGLSILSRVLYPSVCEAAASPTKLASAVRRMVDILVVTMFAAGLCLAVATPWLVGHILPVEYAAATPVLFIFAIALPILGIGTGYGRGLLALGSERCFAMSVGIGAVVNLLLNLLTVPVWGIVGAACSTTISFACVAATNVVLYRHLLATNSIRSSAATAGGGL